jgi:hypothetical protein
MKKLKGAGNRDPEPVTKRDARLPEQLTWPLWNKCCAAVLLEE